MARQSQLVKDWEFLAALQLGEPYAVKNPGKGPPSRRPSYIKTTSALIAMHFAYPNLKWVLRSRDNIIEITLVEKDGQRVDTLPPSSTGRSTPFPTGPSPHPPAWQRKKRKTKKETLAEAVQQHTERKEAEQKLPRDLQQARVNEEQRRVARAIHRSETPTAADIEYLVKVVRAHAVGTPVQELRNGVWLDVSAPRFDKHPRDYRIKPPVPRQWWLRIERGTKKVLDVSETPVAKWDPECTVHVREVFPDEEGDL